VKAEEQKIGGGGNNNHIRRGKMEIVNANRVQFCLLITHSFPIYKQVQVQVTIKFTCFTIPAHLLHGNSEELVIYCVSVIKWQVVTFNTGLWYQELNVF
jgi:hypothetical protein